MAFDSARFMKGKELLWVGGGFLLLTLLAVWPLPLRLTTHVIGWPGDNFYFVWLIEWYSHTIRQGRNAFGPVTMFNYPEGWNIAYNEPTPAMTLPYSFLGGVLGYNISVMVSFVLSGVLTYDLVKRITENSWASWLSGIAFAFAPYRMAHLMGHLNLMGTQWFPLYFGALWAIGFQKKWDWKSVLTGAAGLSLIALTSVYYVYMTALISVVLFSVC